MDEDIQHTSQNQNEDGRSSSLLNIVKSDDSHSWYRFVKPLHTRLEVFDKILFYLVQSRQGAKYDHDYAVEWMDSKKIRTRKTMEELVFLITRHASTGKFRVKSEKSIIGCGSFYEDDSKSKIGDCDYNILLNIRPDYLKYEHVCNIESTIPTRKKRKCYFKVNFTEKANKDNEFVRLWKCENQSCRHQFDTVLCQHAFNPLRLQKEFLVKLQDSLQNHAQIETAHMKIRGPAVSIAMTIPNDDRYSLKPKFTLDLAMAITPDSSWRKCPNKCLDTITKHYHPNLVPSADYWKLSWVQYETLHIRNLPPWVKDIYFECKHIRDSIQPDVPSYPIKQAVLHTSSLVQDFKYQNAAFPRLRCTEYVFEFLINHASEGTFYNYCFPGDQVLDIGDKHLQKCFKIRRDLTRKLDCVRASYLIMWILNVASILYMIGSTVTIRRISDIENRSDQLNDTCIAVNDTKTEGIARRFIDGLRAYFGYLMLIIILNVVWIFCFVYLYQSLKVSAMNLILFSWWVLGIDLMFIEIVLVWSSLIIRIAMLVLLLFLWINHIIHVRKVLTMREMSHPYDAFISHSSLDHDGFYIDDMTRGFRSIRYNELHGLRNFHYFCTISVLFISILLELASHGFET